MASGQRPAAPDDPSQDGQETLGRYRLLKKIARGGMAEVFAARSFGAHGFEKTVAIKRILAKYGDDPQFIRMMVDEAKITVLLNHPNVAQILELCEQDGDYFIVMEFVPGMSLSALRKQLAENGSRIPDLEACYITIELLQGLHAAHTQRDVHGKLANIIHRDVSPQNVLVSFDGHVKVIDFGIARARTRLELTEVGTIKGKLRYLAPEMIDPGRFMRSGDFDHRVDIFAAGIVLWELIASRTLYQGDDEMAVYDAITDSDAPDLHAMKACDKDLSRIVKQALARSPDERFQSAEDLADELRAYVYRRDPKFTHKRIAALMDGSFPSEKAEMLALERGVVAEKPDQRRSGENKPVRVDGKAEPKAAEVRKLEPKKQEPKKPEVVREPEPIPTDAPTRTHLHSNSGGNAAAPGPRGDEAAPADEADARAQRASPGDVLTVMTLVSRKSQPSKRAAAADAPAETEAPAPITADEQTRTSQGRGARASEPSMPSADEAPQTSESLRSWASGAAPARGRMILVSAAVGVILAVVLVIVLEVTGQDPKRPDPTPRPAPSAVKLVVRSTSPGAFVSVAGRELPAPAEFAALPGDVLDVVVRAPGFAEHSERVLVPRTQDRDLEVNVTLTQASADAGPQAASDAGVQATAPDAGPPARDPRDPNADVGVKKKPPDRRAVADKRMGKLKVMSKPAWAIVSIDGKVYGETPVVVDLPAGKHKLVVTGPSKKKLERTVTIRGGDTQTESFEVQ
jgi:serine/threonine protein kinase